MQAVPRLHCVLSLPQVDLQSGEDQLGMLTTAKKKGSSAMQGHRLSANGRQLLKLPMRSEQRIPLQAHRMVEDRQRVVAPQGQVDERRQRVCTR